MDPFSIQVNTIDNGFLFTVRKNGSRKKTFFAADILEGLEEACQTVVGFRVRVHRESLIFDETQPEQ
ncbi:hypothetical protein ACFLR7_05930 [Acidobacteriota bacterium]